MFHHYLKTCLPFCVFLLSALVMSARPGNCEPGNASRSQRTILINGDDCGQPKGSVSTKDDYGDPTWTCQHGTGGIGVYVLHGDRWLTDPRNPPFDQMAQSERTQLEILWNTSKHEEVLEQLLEYVASERTSEARNANFYWKCGSGYASDFGYRAATDLKELCEIRLLLHRYCKAKEKTAHYKKRFELWTTAPPHEVDQWAVPMEVRDMGYQLKHCCDKLSEQQPPLLAKFGSATVEAVDAIGPQDWRVSAEQLHRAETASQRDFIDLYAQRKRDYPMMQAYTEKQKVLILRSLPKGFGHRNLGALLKLDRKGKLLFCKQWPHTPSSDELEDQLLTAIRRTSFDVLPSSYSEESCLFDISFP